MPQTPLRVGGGCGTPQGPRANGRTVLRTSPAAAVDKLKGTPNSISAPESDLMTSALSRCTLESLYL